MLNQIFYSSIYYKKPFLIVSKFLSYNIHLNHLNFLVNFLNKYTRNYEIL